ATVVGVYGVEKELIWSARNLGTSERALTWEVMLPAALPQIFTGLQVALPIALIVGVLTEMAMGGYGIGASMQTASRFADSLGVFAGIIEIAVVGYVLVKLMAVLRARLLVWHPEALDRATVWGGGGAASVQKRAFFLGLAASAKRRGGADLPHPPISTAWVGYQRRQPQPQRGPHQRRGPQPQ